MDPILIVYYFTVSYYTNYNRIQLNDWILKCLIEM